MKLFKPKPLLTIAFSEIIVKKRAKIGKLITQ